MVPSILDTDLYKLTMQQAVLKKYPDAQVEYQFTSRRPTPVNSKFTALLLDSIQALRDLKLTSDEKSFLVSACPFLKPDYIEYLSTFRFNPDQVNIQWETGNKGKDGFDLQSLKLNILGPWHETILWEVPLMATISECYFKTVDTDWNMDGQPEKARTKAMQLTMADCDYSDFGTRRRRSHEVQDLVVENLVDAASHKNLMGTSNVYFAKKYGLRPIGTMAHEWIMGISALESLRHANRAALYAWNDVYHGDLGIALTDTFGTAAFFEDFDGVLARLFDGVRHDSDCPFKFTDQTVAFYKSVHIPTQTKRIVFSDSLDVPKAVALKKYCVDRSIRPAYGIGTHLTNDFEGSPALNMVIKLRAIAKNKTSPFVQVVKLSDDLGKATGDRDALRVAKYVFFGTPLDQ